MATPTLVKQEFINALKALGNAVGGYNQIEIVLVGGLAGLLGGWLPESQTTKDADVIACDPEQSMGYIESEAFKIAKDMGLPARWLNCASHGYLWAIPEGWKTRLHNLGAFGLIHVFYVDRLDLIALKVVASRDVDRAHLLAMRVTASEITRVEKHLNGLDRAGADAHRIQQARNTLKILHAAS